jgi:hypothetical protein
LKDSSHKEGAVEKDLRIFSHENILEQIKTAEYRNGYYVLEFYAENNKPSAEPTDIMAKFYLYPSGGTLRDSNFQLLFYDSRYDTYRGFKPPHLTRQK